MPTLLELVAACDSFDPADAVQKRTAFPFHVAGCHVGFVPDFVVPALMELAESSEETEFSFIYAIPDDPSSSPYMEAVELDPEGTMGFLRRTKAMDALLRHWRATDAFPCLRGWREERYPVYGDPSLARNMVMTIERSGAELFGIRTFGAHLTCFVRESEMRIWVAQRSPTKQTFPGMLDNTVAGGIPYDQTPGECMVRECEEEAGIPAWLAEKARPVGAVTYNTLSRHNGIGPEAQFVYDLELPPDFLPVPQDGEVAGFRLCTVPEVLSDVRAGRFKPNCAIIAVDFLIRHGFITPENEPEYLAVTARLHKESELAGPM
ncbi:NUDIX hydrolase domain-like protein, partial [Hyaloraphidium curvatum]